MTVESVLNVLKELEVCADTMTGWENSAARRKHVKDF